MTQSKYYIARLLKSFGVVLKRRRMMDAASELHLMQEGYEILADLCWEKTEKVEEISPEYWKLRKLNTKRQSIIEKWNEAEEVLNQSKSRREEISGRSQEESKKIRIEKGLIEESLKEVIEKKDQMVANAASVRRKYDMLKTKRSVLREEGQAETDQYDLTRKELKVLRVQFESLKEERLKVAAEIVDLENDLKFVQEKIAQKKLGVAGKDTESFTDLAKTNRDITKYRAEIGLIDDERAQIFRLIGKYLAENAKTSESCREATSEYFNLVQQIELLNRSVNYNHALAAEE